MALIKKPERFGLLVPRSLDWEPEVVGRIACCCCSQSSWDAHVTEMAVAMLLESLIEAEVERSDPISVRFSALPFLAGLWVVSRAFALLAELVARP